VKKNACLSDIASLHFLAAVNKINCRITWWSERSCSNIYF